MEAVAVHFWVKRVLCPFLFSFGFSFAAGAVLQVLFVYHCFVILVTVVEIPLGQAGLFLFFPAAIAG